MVLVALRTPALLDTGVLLDSTSPNFKSQSQAPVPNPKLTILVLVKELCQRSALTMRTPCARAVLKTRKVYRLID